MRRSNFAVLLAIIVVAACSTPASQQSSELAGMSDAFEGALNAGDIDALVALYAEDVRLMPPNAEIGQGRDAVRAVFGEMIEGGLRGELETLEAVVAGDVGYHVGTYALQTAEGMMLDRGKFMETWRKVDGEWKIANDIWNSAMPAAGQGQLIIATHEVADAATWLAAWQGPDSRHEMFAQHGAPNVRVFQSASEPNLTGLLIEVADMEALQAFLDSPEGAAAKAEDGVVDATMRVFAEVK